MNAITEIIVTIAGILILSFIIYLIVDIYHYHKAKGRDKSFIGTVKSIAREVSHETKRGFRIITGKTTKDLGRDVYHEGKKLGHKIARGARITGHDIATGAKKTGQALASAAETTERGVMDVVDSSTFALAEDAQSAISGLAKMTDSALGLSGESEEGEQPSMTPTPQPTPRSKSGSSSRAIPVSEEATSQQQSQGQGIISTIGKDIEDGAKDFVEDVVRGTERVFDSTTGEIPKEMRLFASGIEKINQKIESGLKDLKQDIFHIHGRLDRAEDKSHPESVESESIPRHTKHPKYTPNPTPTPEHHDTTGRTRDPRHPSHPHHPGHKEYIRKHPHMKTHDPSDPYSEPIPTRDPGTAFPEHPRHNFPAHREKPSGLKEVFNVSQNIFTYDEAPLVCKSLGAELATYDQLLDAYKTGANWCNYGWTQNQMAMYPTQEKFFDELQRGPEQHRNDCGKPGLNGGYFADKNMKFGVNCYGMRPGPDPSRIVYLDKETENERIKHPDEFYHVEGLNHKFDQIKRKLKKHKVSSLPFSPHRWSRDSSHNSKYMVEQNYVSADVPADLVPTEDPDDVPEGPTCAKTRFGCCKDGVTPRADCTGTNCPENKRRCLPRCPHHRSKPKKAADHNYVVAEETVL